MGAGIQIFSANAKETPVTFVKSGTMTVMSDDNELVKRALEGDRRAFAVLVERHYDLIYRLAFKVVRERADAEDIAQDVCVSLARRLESFGGRSRLTTWLYQVTLNAARDFLRRKATIGRLQSDFAEQAEMDRADEAERQRDSDWAYEAIATLKEDLRETALLVVSEGLNHAEAGEVLGIREATISWRMMKVRNHLKDLAQQKRAGMA